MTTETEGLRLDASGDDRRYRHITKALDEMVWAITPPMLATIQAIATRRFRDGERLEQHEIDEALADASHHGHEFAPLMIEYELRGQGRGGAARSGQIAVLPVYGVIMPRATVFSSMSGGTSVEQVMAAFNSAANDPNVTSILFDIDSPGGSSDLIAELGQLIFDARGSKPIAAVANTDAGSAACWIASQCDEVGVTPSGKIGSIGVYGTHEDLSEALAMKGIKPTTIQYGEYKTELSPYGPLSDEAKAYVQSVVDSMGDMFTGAVARGRGVSAATVSDKFGQGRMLMAKDAVKVGLADRVATYDEMLTRLARGAVSSGKPSKINAAGAKLVIDAEPETDPSLSAAAQRDDKLRELLEGANATAIKAGNENGPLVIELEHDVTPSHLEHLSARLEPLAAELGRKIVVLAKGHTLSDADRAQLETDAPETDSTAAAAEPPQTPSPAGHLHRRAVRAALREAAKGREGGTT